MSSCVVCEIILKNIDSNIIYENENIICFLDHSPINCGHVLICPKIHCSSITDVPDSILMEIIGAAKGFSLLFYKYFKCDGATIMQNDGIFNDLSHFHMHVFPRKKADGFAWNFREEHDPTPETLENICRVLKLQIEKTNIF